MTQHVLTLRGCTPEPLGNYLKALGIFRLIAEQADPQVRAWWKDGHFVLLSRFASNEELIAWFKVSYQPSPMPVPWSVNSGWWPPDNQPPSKGDKRATANKHLRDIESSTDIRFSIVRDCIREALQAVGGALELADRETTLSVAMKEVLKKLESQTKKSKERVRLIGDLRNHLKSSSALRWLDAVGALSLRNEGSLYPFQLLADCGAEGVNSYIGNYYARLCEHLPVSVTSDEFWMSNAGMLSHLRLRAALLGENIVKARQNDAAGGMYSPAVVEAPNIGQTFVASPKKRVNPWDFILTMEGLVVWASAATKRSEVLVKEHPSFPFFCDSAIGGANAIGPLELSGETEGKSRGEIWCPLWIRPSSFQEIDRLFVEGRITQGQNTATRATQFALAVSSFGLERGISSFLRVGLMERGGSGDQTTTLAVSLGDIPVRRLLGIDLCMELGTFVDQISAAVQHNDNQPKRIVSARSRFDQAIFDITMSSNQKSEVTPKATLNLLIAASTLERELGVTLGKVKYKVGQRLLERSISPINPLSKRWIISEPSMRNPSNDGSAEYRLAQSISSIALWESTEAGHSSSAVEGIRANLLPVTRSGTFWQWDNKSRSAVWARGAPLMDNLASVLRRRFIDAQKGNGDGLPLWGSYGARFSDILALWQGEVDEVRLADLIHALALINTGFWTNEKIDQWVGKHDPTPDIHPNGVWFDNSGDAHTVLKASYSDDDLRYAFELPREYVLLKLCFVGGRLPARPVEGKTISRTGDEPYPPCAAEIINLLQAGRLSEAIEIAARKLRASGYPTILETRRRNVSEFSMAPDLCRRLAGLLLIPVRHAGLLASLVIKPITSTH